jgi:4-amino-4-deoxy-L-arabinose transferase-like glycosyltransferase
MKKLSDLIAYNEKRLLIVFFTFSLLIKLIYVIIIYQKQGLSGWVDDKYYLMIGGQFATGNFSPHPMGEQYLRVAPLIPLVVAFFYKIFGDPIIPFFAYNIILSSLLVPILYYLGKELVDNFTGWLMALWGLCNIEFFKYTPHILKEPTIYLLIPLILLLVLQQIRKANFVNLILAAILFSILIHTDERYIVYLPVFPVILFFYKPPKSAKIMREIIIWFSVVFLLMIPWTIRNYQEYGQIVIISHRTTPFTSKLWGKDIYGMKFVKTKQNILHNDRLQSNDTRVINPIENNRLNLYFKTFVNIWQPTFFKTKKVRYSWWVDERNQKWSLRHNLISFFFYGLFLPFYVIGLIISIKRKNILLLFIGLLPVIHNLLHTFMVMPEERYRYPFVFIIVMIGIWALKESLNFLRNTFSVSKI